MINNIFNIENSIPKDNIEIFESIINKTNIQIKRIISNGQIFPIDGSWYSQNCNEWVCLIQGEAIIHLKNKSPLKLIKGDYIFIPKNSLHKVTYTSKTPECIWLAIYFND